MAEVAKHVTKRSEDANTIAVRVAYPYIHEKQTKRRNGAPRPKPRYEATLLFPKLNADPAQCANYQWLNKHIMDAAVQAWGMWPEGGRLPIEDGDIPYKPKPPMPGQAAAPVDPNKYAWRRGNWIVEVTNYFDPGPAVSVMNGNQRLDIPAKVINGKQMYKGGDFAIVHMHAFTYHNDGYGVNFGFKGICFVGQGDAIGSSGPKSAAAMFGSIPNTPGMQTAGAQLQVAAVPVAQPPMQPPPQQYAPPAQPQYAPSPPMAPQQYAQPAPVPQQYAPPVAPVAGPPAAPVAPVPGGVGLPPLPR